MRPADRRTIIARRAVVGGSLGIVGVAAAFAAGAFGDLGGTPVRHSAAPTTTRATTTTLVRPAMTSRPTTTTTRSATTTTAAAPTTTTTRSATTTTAAAPTTTLPATTTTAAPTTTLPATTTTAAPTTTLPATTTTAAAPTTTLPATTTTAAPTTTLPATTTTAAPTTTTGVEPGSVLVEVLNGNGVSGAAGQAATALHDAGFAINGTGNAPAFTYAETVVAYPPGAAAQAETVAAHVIGAVELRTSPQLPTGVVDLILGDTYDGITP